MEVVLVVVVLEDVVEVVLVVVVLEWKTLWKLCWCRKTLWKLCLLWWCWKTL